MTKPYEVPQQMRDAAERSVAQARQAFEKFAEATTKAGGSANEATSKLVTGARDVGAKAMGMAEANMKAAFDHAQRLIQAKDLQEVLKLQGEYAKSQIAALQEQAKELGSAVQNATTRKTS